MGEATEEVKSRIDIVAVIGEYVELRKAGSTYKGICPFHEEKTASMMVNPAKQTFHCFGCGVGGDVFTFVMKHDRVEFAQALELLAKRAGVEITARRGSGNRIYEMNAAAASFFTGNLRKNSRIQSYLKEERGLTDESIERFQIGCTNGTALWSHLGEKGFAVDEIVKASLARTKNCQTLDYFWKRVMFPIALQGKIRGFGGRVLDGTTPKYLNSAETPVFSKKDILYGLDTVAIKEMGFAMIAEGYLDVIMAHQNGYKNTVAPLGTALTVDQIKLLRKYCNRIYLVFDGDAAGERAAIRGAQFLFKEKLSGGIVILPEGEDQDSFLRKGGDMEAVLRAAVPFPVYLSRKVPRLRRRILEHLLFRSPIETSEFLAYESSPEERRMTAEMSARRAMTKLFAKSSVVVRKDGVEVRIHEGFVALFSAGGFKFMRNVEGDHKKQASTMLKDYLALKKKYNTENIEKGK